MAKRKRVKCIDTGQIFESAAEVSMILGIPQSTVTAACNGRVNSARGMYFEYADETDNAIIDSFGKRHILQSFDFVDEDNIIEKIIEITQGRDLEVRDFMLSSLNYFKE